MTSEPQYNLVELFWSAQGEGPHVGRSTIFLRFGGCDLRCSWCDSPGTWIPARQCLFESSPGSGRFDKEPNPISHDRLVLGLAGLAPRVGSFLSLTGGEPLLQPEAVVGAAGIGRKMGLRIFLETHGLAVAAMAEVAGSVDYVSMDWKLDSAVRWADPEAPHPGPSSFADRHAAFLELLTREKVEACVKVVVTCETTAQELDQVCSVLAATAPGAPLILQPVTPFGQVRERPSADQLLEHLRACEGRLEDVRLIPQTHRVYGAP
ncbi:MAG: 7-carboxy-7-deazaguanine synthase QueE [Myxococcota bacterium]|nr:7-carboxy-7-deazaguanine synthase QueE [Myxococcota bacterium]